MGRRDIDGVHRTTDASDEVGAELLRLDRETMAETWLFVYRIYLCRCGIADDVSTISRRETLNFGAVGLLGGIAGCLGGNSRRSSAEKGRSATTRQSWPQFQQDGGNLGRTNVLEADRRYDTLRWQSQHSSSGGQGGVANPVVHDGLLYVGEFDNDEYRIVALDAADATRTWSRSLRGQNATPAIAGGTLFVPTTNVVESNRVSAYDAADGTEQWHFDFDGGRVMAATHRNSTILVAQAATFDGAHPARVLAIAEDGTKLWQTDVEGSIEAPVAANDGKVFVGTTAGRLEALDIETGKSEWTIRTDGEVRCAPSVNDGLVFVADKTGTVYSVSMAGTEQWRASASSPAPGTGLAVTTDSVYVGGEEGLDALAQEDGSHRWSVAKNSRATTPAVGSGTVYFGTEDALLAVGTKSGELRWSREIGTVQDGDTIIQGVLSAPAIAEDGFYVGTAPGLYAFTADESVSP